MTPKRIFNVTDKMMIRLLLAVIVLLVFIGGYYNIRFHDTERNYKALYVKYKQLQKQLE